MPEKFNVRKYLAKIAQDLFNTPAQDVEKGIERLLKDADKIKDENKGDE